MSDLPKWHMTIDGGHTIDALELFPDDHPHRIPRTIADVAELLRETRVETFLTEWSYLDTVDISFRDPESGRVFLWVEQGATVCRWADGRSA